MSFLREHNPEIDWKEGQLEFTRCARKCAPISTPIHKEELAGIMPHLEDVAKNEYGELDPEPWDDKEQFVYWMEHSDDPQARALRARVEEKSEAPGAKDKEY